MTAVVGSDATLDTNGNVEVHLPGTTVVSDCRAEGNPLGRFVRVNDGDQYVYSALIYLPIQVEDIPVGSIITVVDNDTNTVCAGNVRAVQRQQKGVRLWL